MKRIFMLLCLIAFISACSSVSDDPAVMFKGQTADQIFSGGEQALVSHAYSDAAQHFEGLQALYPFSKHAEQAQLDLIYAYFMNDDMASTVAACDRYIHLYPRNDHADYAYYMKGRAEFNQSRGVIEKFIPIDLAQRDLGTMRDSLNVFTMLVELYPNSIYAADAEKRMVYVRNLMAAHEMEISDYYFKRKAYVAAANRATNIVMHFQHSPSVKPALIMLVKANRAMGETDAAERAEKVLAMNYPDAKIS